MRSLQDRLREIELELHTLETATPRNSATVDRGRFLIEGEGRVVVVAGGTVFFAEGGSVISDNYSLENETGWQVGTERRGSSVVVIKDIPGANIEVSTANSYADFLEVELVPGEPVDVVLDDYNTVAVQIFHISEEQGTLSVGDKDIIPTPVIKSKLEQWAYSHLTWHSDNLTITADMENVTVRLLSVSVNNVS